MMKVLTCKRPIGAVVVDPEQNRILVCGGDQSVYCSSGSILFKPHTLHHASVVCITLISALHQQVCRVSKIPNSYAEL